MISEPHWTAVLSALMTPVIAVIGGYIAWRQWRTAQNRLKLDLFDRRFAIYAAAQTFIMTARSARIEDGAYWKFLQDTHQARWLLDERVADYLKKGIYNQVVELQTLISELEGEGPGEQRTKNVQAQRQGRNALDAALTELDRMFAQYIQLSH